VTGDYFAMNNQLRAELLAAIAELCQQYPDWRLGQLIASVAGWADQGVWDVEDEQLLEAALLHLQQSVPSPRSRKLARGPRLSAAIGWGVAGAVATSAGWLVGLALTRALLGVAVLGAPLQGRVLAETTVVLAVIGAVCGTLAGGMAGLLLGEPSRIGAGLLGAIGGAAVGALGGGLSPPLVAATAVWLPAEVSSAAAWGLAGLVAGFVGYGCRKVLVSDASQEYCEAADASAKRR